MKKIRGKFKTRLEIELERQPKVAIHIKKRKIRVAKLQCSGLIVCKKN